MFVKTPPLRKGSCGRGSLRSGEPTADQAGEAKETAAKEQQAGGFRGSGDRSEGDVADLAEEVVTAELAVELKAISVEVKVSHKQAVGCGCDGGGGGEGGRDTRNLAIDHGDRGRIEDGNRERDGVEDAVDGYGVGGGVEGDGSASGVGAVGGFQCERGADGFSVRDHTGEDRCSDGRENP